MFGFASCGDCSPGFHQILSSASPVPKPGGNANFNPTSNAILGMRKAFFSASAEITGSLPSPVPQTTVQHFLSDYVDQALPCVPKAFVLCQAQFSSPLPRQECLRYPAGMIPFAPLPPDACAFIFMISPCKTGCKLCTRVKYRNVCFCVIFLLQCPLYVCFHPIPRGSGDAVRRCCSFLS